MASDKCLHSRYNATYLYGTNIGKLEVLNQPVFKSLIARILKVCNVFGKLH